MTEAFTFASAVTVLMVVLGIVGAVGIAWMATVPMSRHFDETERMNGEVRVTYRPLDRLFHVDRARQVWPAPGATRIEWDDCGAYATESEAMDRAQEMRGGDRVVAKIPARAD